MAQQTHFKLPIRKRLELERQQAQEKERETAELPNNAKQMSIDDFLNLKPKPKEEEQPKEVPEAVPVEPEEPVPDETPKDEPANEEPVKKKRGRKPKPKEEEQPVVVNGITLKKRTGGRPKAHPDESDQILIPPARTPLSMDTTPRGSGSGAYGNTTPDKAVQIGNIITSGIDELKKATLKPRVLKGDYDEIMKRTFEYMERKAYEQRLPSMEGLAVSLGISRRALMQWRDDTRDPRVHDFLTAVTEQFSAMWTESTQSGLVNPVAWIFYAKNHYGYVDKQEVDVKARAQAEEIQDEDTIRKRWLTTGSAVGNTEDGE